jgi:hypothetical protein
MNRNGTSLSKFAFRGREEYWRNYSRNFARSGSGKNMIVLHVVADHQAGCRWQFRESPPAPENSPLKFLVSCGLAWQARPMFRQEDVRRRG